MTGNGGLGSSTVPETRRVWDAYRAGSNVSYEVPLANGNYTVTPGSWNLRQTAAGVAALFTTEDST